MGRCEREAAAETHAMSWISWLCFGICLGIVLSCFRKGADMLSPARVFGFVWSLAVGLTELKFSALQHTWNLLSWVLLLTGIGAFLVGIFIAFVLNLGKELVPISEMRQLLRKDIVRETQLFWFISAAVAVYGISYLVIYMVKGFLPVFVVGTKISRVDFYVFGFGVFINSTAFIIFFTVLYHLLVQGKRGKKIFLTCISLIAVGSYFLLLQRFQIIMAALMCFTLLYYATNSIRLRTALPLLGAVTAFFYWIASLRGRHLELLSMYIYTTAKMRFPKSFASLTEPYMYMVMNLENFARSVNWLDHHTYGYYTFDFVTAITGLKYWISDYFGIERFPYLVSGYNTYTAFWVLYRDFGVIGLIVIPLTLGLGIGLLYYRMRTMPTIKRVTAYGVMVFVMFISFFVFPISFLWFLYNMLALYWILRCTMIPRMGDVHSLVPSPQSNEGSSLGERRLM
jgi:oligosaccharide repeat unit polymerase